MAQKKYTRGNKNQGNDLVGIVLVIISAFFLLCLCIPIVLGPISKAVRHVTVGVFGFMAYPLFLCMLLLGIAVIQKRKLRVPPKTVVGICAIVFFVSVILQLATSYFYIGEGIGSYISKVYDNFTAGGVFFGIFAYAIQSVITQVFTYIVCSLCILLIGAFMLRDKLGFGKRKEEIPESTERRTEFRKGLSAPLQVKPLADTSLYVDTIQPVSTPIESDYGSFTQLSEPPQTNMQGYSTLVPPNDVQDGGFISYNTNKNEGDYADKKAKAMDVLYGGTDNFRVMPTAPTNVSTNTGSDTSGFQSYNSMSRPGIIPPYVFGEPDIRPVEENKETEKKKPPKVLHIQDIQGLKPIPNLPRKDISGDYVGGYIINGDIRSQEIAETNTPLPKDTTVREQNSSSAYPRIDNFDKRRVEPTQILPNKNYNFTNNGAFDEPREQEPAPIVNGDYFNKGNREPEKTPEIPPVVKSDNSRRAIDELESKYDAFYNGEPIAKNSDNKSDFIDGAVDSVDETPDFGKATSQPAEDFSKKFDDEVIDLSEKGFSNENDHTGYYNVVEDTPDFTQPIEFTVHKNDDKPKARKSPIGGQIGLDDYARENAATVPSKSKTKKHRPKYNAPPIELLSSVPSSFDAGADDSVEKAKLLEETLRGLKLPATVSAITRGPTVTRYELEMPPGIPVKRIGQYVQDIEYNLAVNGSIRIETPIPGKRAVGVEVPNNIVDVVSLRDVMNTKEFASASSPLTVAVGKDIAGQNILCALDKMPHLLVAGATGTGKSVCLNSIIVSLLYKSSPEDVRVILVDPKQVEFSVYRNMPHLLGAKIITDAKEAFNAFKYLKNKMEDRYKLFSNHIVRNIQEYNKLDVVKSGEEEKLPYIVLIVDELADLMISNDVSKKDLEDKIMSLAQKARAAGIHLILATQRPSVNVITGTIKANLPSRIAFSVKSGVDSTTILDQYGAETLLGRGDMLYAPLGFDEPRRLQGAFISNEEVTAVVDYVRENNEADFDEEFLKSLEVKDETPDPSSDEEESEFDPLMQNVLKLVIETGTASTTFIQRRFAVGYARAARIMDQMEMHKFVGPSEGAKPRQIYISREQYKEMFGEEI